MPVSTTTHVTHSIRMIPTVAAEGLFVDEFRFVGYVGLHHGLWILVVLRRGGGRSGSSNHILDVGEHFHNGS